MYFAQHDVEAAPARILQQTVELGAFPVAARIIVVAVNIVYLPALLYRVPYQHGLLVLDAAAVLPGVCLVRVLLRQAAVNGGARRCTRKQEQPKL